MGPFFGMIRYVFNGAKLPNWMKLIVILAVVAAVFLSQYIATNTLADVQRETTAYQIQEIRRAVRVLRSDIEGVSEEDSVRTTEAFNKVIRRVARVEAKVDDIDENGSEGSNRRIDELSRLIKRYR